MRAIIIIGASGAGKTAYAEGLGCPCCIYNKKNETVRYALSNDLMHVEFL